MTQDEPCHVLFLDDNPEDRAWLAGELARALPALRLWEIEGGEAFAAALERGGFDLVVINHPLQTVDSLDAVRAVKTRYPEIPVLMFAGAGAEQLAVAGMKAGLDDYVVTSQEALARLPLAIRTALERTRAQREAREYHARFQALFEGAPVGIYRASPAGQLLEVNPAMVEMLGYPGREALLEQSAADLHADPEEHARWQGLAAREGAVRDVEMRFRRRDGSLLWTQNRTRAIYDQGGRIAYYEGVLQDITERKQAEQAIRELAGELEERVRRRTEELAAANRELEAFSYSVSHDLRSPLRSLDGFSRILLEEHAAELSPKAQRYLQTIRRNAQHMGHLVDDLLAFSRLGRQPLRAEPVALAAVVREALWNLTPEREGRNVEIQVEELPVCLGDPALLRQALMNLLSNALKFTRGREKAEIHLGCASEKEDPNEAVVFVRDNGVGFDMRYADKLFGVFQRLHRADEYEGTGVGLAIVQRILHRHGGRVWAKAEKDRGATFFFSVPLAPTQKTV